MPLIWPSVGQPLRADALPVAEQNNEATVVTLLAHSKDFWRALIAVQQQTNALTQAPAQAPTEAPTQVHAQVQMQAQIPGCEEEPLSARSLMTFRGNEGMLKLPRNSVELENLGTLLEDPAGLDTFGAHEHQKDEETPNLCRRRLDDHLTLMDTRRILKLSS